MSERMGSCATLYKSRKSKNANAGAIEVAHIHSAIMVTVQLQKDGGPLL